MRQVRVQHISSVVVTHLCHASQRCVAAKPPAAPHRSMTLTDTDALTKRQISRREGSAPLKVTGRLKRALDLMVWERLTDNKAAVEAGLTISALRMALQRPHVAAYYKAQREVLRQREAPANIHRLLEIRDAANNMPAVQAIKVLEQLGDEANGRAAATVAAPGLVVVINTGGSEQSISAKVVPHDADEQ